MKLVVIGGSGCHVLYAAMHHMIFTSAQRISDNELICAASIDKLPDTVQSELKAQQRGIGIDLPTFKQSAIHRFNHIDLPEINEGAIYPIERMTDKYKNNQNKLRARYHGRKR